MVVLIARSLAQTLSQFLLKGILYGVAVEAQLVQLLGHCLHIVRMAVTDADDGMTSIEVEILLSFVVPHGTALSLRDVDIKQGIDIEEPTLCCYVVIVFLHDLVVV